MAIYHLSVKAVSRSAGRSATAAAAYRAGCEIADGRTGEIHDYTRKGGVESAALILPDNAPEWARDRAQLWNAAEQAEKRKNSTVAREFEIALPAELSPAEREKLAHDFAREILKPGGAFVAKVLRGGTERTLLDRLKKDFEKVRHFKPEASRADSAEMYVVGTGFRG